MPNFRSVHVTLELYQLELLNPNHKQDWGGLDFFRKNFRSVCALIFFYRIFENRVTTKTYLPYLLL